ncbi:MAG: MerR family transcriptional regulator [Crocinitomicaceae bacterium]
MAGVRYSIKDLENFTQIKAHTIRIWEQRYSLLEPKRTDTKIRYYSENDLKKILNINLLYSSGHKISKIAKLSDTEIIDAAKSLIFVSEAENQSVVDTLTLLILDFNGVKINEILNTELERTGLIEMYDSIVLPLLKKIGQLWHVNSIDIIHEHYFSNLLKGFLIFHIESLSVKSDNDKTAFLFLHDNEEHEFSILLYYYLLKKRGYTCYYFGQKIPIKELEVAYKQLQPKIVITTFVARISEKNFEKIHNVLYDFSKKSQVLISGNQLSHLNYNISSSLLYIKTIDQLLEILK